MRGIEQIPWLYDAFCALCERCGLGRWRRWLVAGAGGAVLDVGCGTGRNLPLYARGTRVIGVDVSADALARARRRRPDVPLVQADAEALPFRAASFDTVVSALVFCSVPDAGRGLLETRRVLRSEGTLRMLEHVRSMHRFKARLQDRWQPLWTRLTGGCRWNRDTEAAVLRAGFTIDAAERRARGDMRRFVARPRR